MNGIAPVLESVLAVLVLALLARLLVRNHERLSFTSILLFVGVFVAIFGVSFDIELTSEVVLMVLLPAIIFHGTTTLNVRRLWRNILLIGILTLVGLPLSVVILGGIGTVAFGFPLIISLLFATIVLPTDPAAVLSLFEEFGVTERLAVTIEGESVFNDGVAIVIFSALIELHESTTGSTASLLTLAGLADVATEVVIVGGGGLVLGSVVGYLAHIAMRRLDDEMAMLMLTVLVAYGSFLIAEHYIGLSGILAVVGAGLLMGAHETTHEKMTATEYHVQEFWTTVAFLMTTVLYILIGAEIQTATFVQNADLVALAVLLVFVVRALTIYPVVTVTNFSLRRPIPLNWQHIMVWGGLHTVVPVALVLSLPETVPFRQELQVMVFGVAVISTIVQGLLMPTVLRRTGLIEPKT